MSVSEVPPIVPGTNYDDLPNDVQNLVFSRDTHEDRVALCDLYPDKKECGAVRLEQMKRSYQRMALALTKKLARPILALAFDPSSEGKNIVSSSGLWSEPGQHLAYEKGILRVWSRGMSTEFCLVTKNLVKCMAWDPTDNGQIAFADYDTVKVWSIRNHNRPDRPELILTMSESCRQGIDAIVYSAEGDKIASGDSSGHINVWSTQNGNRLYQYDEQIADIESLRFAEDTLYVSTIPNRYMIYAEGFRVYKFNLHQKNDVTIVNPHPQTTFYVECVCLSPDSKRIAVGEWNLGNDNSHAVRMYNTTTGEMLLELMTESETATRKVTFTPDGKFLVSLNSNQMLFVYDLQTGRRVHTHSALLANDQPYIPVTDVVAHGSMIAWGDSTGCVWQYDMKTGRTF